MVCVTREYAAWLELVSDLVARASPVFPRAEVTAQLVASFQAVVSWNWMDESGVGFELSEQIPGWPTDDEVEYWLTEGIAIHPLVCWFQHTLDVRPMTMARVPAALVPADGFEVFRDMLRPVGLEQQLSIPYDLSPGRHHAFVFGQGGDDFSDDHLELARRIQPLIALLARQASLLDRAGCASARDPGLTGRELGVLRLLHEGRTAVSIAHALDLSPRTVHCHLASIYRKLGVSDRMRAVIVAQELGVLAAPYLPGPRTSSGGPPSPLPQAVQHVVRHHGVGGDDHEVRTGGEPPGPGAGPPAEDEAG